MTKYATKDASVAIGIVCTTFIALLFMTTIMFAPRVADSQSLANGLVIAAGLFVAASWIVHRLPQGLLKTSLHTAMVLGLFAFLFGAMDGLQHIIVHGWMDDVLISADEALIGVELSLLFQQFVTPLLTECMMFAYVVYIPLLPLVALICYRSGGSDAAADYLLNLSLANILCYLGFILFPVASPLYHAPELYNVPLDGGFFTLCGEWIRRTQHYAGGSLPSPHCAAGTVMVIMLHRHNRSLFYLILPTMLTLYVSTVYGRYHYSWDSIAGILVAFAVVRVSPHVVAATDALLAWFGRLCTARTMPESVSETN